MLGSVNAGRERGRMTDGGHFDEAEALALFERLDAAVAARERDMRNVIEGLDVVAGEVEDALTGEWGYSRGSIGEADAGEAIDLGPSVHSVYGLIQEETRLLARVLANHLRGLRSLLHPGDSALSAVVVARAVFEVGLRAESLLDSNCTTDVRLKRALNRRLARLHGQVVSEGMLRGQASGEHAQLAAGEMETITGWAQGRGWKVRFPKYEAPVVERDESVSMLAADLLEDGTGRYFWKTLSSTSHGELGSDVTGWLDVIDELGGTAPSWLLLHWTIGAAVPPVTLLQQAENYLGVELDASLRALAVLTMWRQAAGVG